jgi:hypothetical protein
LAVPTLPAPLATALRLRRHAGPRPGRGRPVFELLLGPEPKLVADAKYIPLPGKAYELGTKRLVARKTGSMFGGKGSQVGVSIESLLSEE